MASEESLAAVAQSIKAAANDHKIGGMDYERWSNEDILIERCVLQSTPHRTAPHVLPSSFRPNIVLRGSEVAFSEDTWQKIAIGPKHDTRLRQKESMIVTLVSKCTRCLVRCVPYVSSAPVADRLLTRSSPTSTRSQGSATPRCRTRYS